MAKECAAVGRRLRRMGLAIVVSLTAALPVTAQTYDILHAFYAPPGAPNEPLVETDGTIYATTAGGGQFARGTLFRRDPDGTVTTLHHFSESDGSIPFGRLTRGSDGALYGATLGDGSFGNGDNGTLFRWDGQFTTLYKFGWSNGSHPRGGVTLGIDGALYGTTQEGGAFGQGTLFKWNGSLTTLHSFRTGTVSNGGYPSGPLAVGADGAIYGTTSAGGASGHTGPGILFKWNGALTILHRFTFGFSPTGVTRGNDGALYGMTTLGGFHPSGGGTIFKWNGSMALLHSFNTAEGGYPLGPVIQGTDGALYGATDRSMFKWNGGLTTLHYFDAPTYPYTGVAQGSDGLLFGVFWANATPDSPGTPDVLFRFDSHGSVFEPLITFAKTEPSDLVSIVYGNDGSLYGTTTHGGQHGYGTFFRLTADGTFTVLHSFDLESGAVPGRLAKGIDGTLYGGTSFGGPTGYGTRFKWNGTLTFGDDPFSWEGVGVQGADGAWYVAGGGGGGDYGSIWRWDGSLTVLHTFVAWEGGAYPQNVAVGSDGAVYGRTRYGGAFGNGTLFKWHAGTLSTLHDFVSPSDEPFPPTVIEGSDGAIYGTLVRGFSGWGSIFKWDSATGLTSAHDFSGTDGFLPYSGVVQGTDGALYGATYAGAATTPTGWGTVFRWRAGNLTTLHQFDYENGGHPTDLLVMGDGAVYGFTREGGPYRKGVIFRVTLPDETAPVVLLNGGPADGGSYHFGSVPPAPICDASDAQSGLAGPCTVSGYDTSVGAHTLTAMATDKAGNQGSVSISYTVLPLTLSGLYQPIDMNGVWNVVKNGSTVPLKFEVFAGTTELTDTTLVAQPLTATQVACNGGVTDEVELLSSGGTSLRYDNSDGHFVYNWKTPNVAGYCYVVTVRLTDGSAVSANVRTK